MKQRQARRRTQKRMTKERWYVRRLKNSIQSFNQSDTEENYSAMMRSFFAYCILREDKK